MSRPVERPSALSDQVVTAIERQIRTGKIPPGSRLPSERELCESFGVSRMVVREAIARLKSDGYMETRQGAGTIVPEQPGRLSYRLATHGRVPRDELAHIMELRMAVEVAAAELAALRRTREDIKAMREALAMMREAVTNGTDASRDDDRFHQAIASATQNPHLERFVDFLRHQFGVTRRATWVPKSHRNGEAAKAQGEHERLFAAIEEQDCVGARRIADEHLRSSAARLALELPYIDHRSLRTGERLGTDLDSEQSRGPGRARQSVKGPPPARG